MGEQEHGTCQICGKHGTLERTYIHFDYKCECHSPEHFQIIYHCKKHAPRFVAENTTLKKALEEMTCKGKKLCCELGNAMFEIKDLKKALEEAKKEVEELRYRFRLCGIDNPLPAEEEKHYKSPLHYCPHGIKITETCVDCGRKGESDEKTTL